MKVIELIRELSMLDPHAEVGIDDADTRTDDEPGWQLPLEKVYLHEGRVLLKGDYNVEWPKTDAAVGQ